MVTDKSRKAEALPLHESSRAFSAYWVAAASAEPAATVDLQPVLRCA